MIVSMFGALFSVAAVAADRFDEREKTFVAGLRHRQLFDIAERYCTLSLARNDISVTDQAALTVELMQNRASQALIAPANQRPSAWQSVWQTQRDFNDAFARHPKSILVTIQTALSRLSYAASIQQEISAEMIRPADVELSKEMMIDQLRTARRTFEKVEREIDRLLPEQRSRSVSQDELSAQQLSTMRSNVRYQLAKCHLQTAYGYEASDSVNRTSIINDVLQRLSEVQNSAGPQQRIWWLAKVTQVECLRLIGRSADAQKILNRLPNEDRPLDLNSAILEQRLLLAVARSDVQWAVKHLRQSETQRLSGQTPQMDIAQMRAAVMVAGEATSDADRQRWLGRAALIVQGIESDHGPYWSRRAGLALIEATGSSSGLDVTRPSAGQREILIQTAARAARNGNDTDALKAWQRAIELTPVGGERQNLQINAAKIFERLKRYPEAAEILLTGALEVPQSEIAAAMHLRGCWNIAQTGSGDELIAELKAHLKQWPESSTVDQASIWLAAEFSRRHEFDSSVTTLTISQREASVNKIRQLRSTFYSIQKHSGGQPDSAGELSKRIVDYFRQQSANTADAELSEKMVATAAEIALLSGCISPTQTDALIQQHAARFTIDPRSPLRLYSSVLNVLIGDDPSAAMLTLENLTPSENDCRKLASIVKANIVRNPASAFTLNQFLLSVAEQALRRPLSVQQMTAWKFEQAKLLRATRQYKRSLALLTPLAQQFRNDAAIQMEYARALTQSGDRLEEALKAWRRLTQQLKPKTENWYEAKLNVGRSLAKSGQGEEAKKMLRYLEAVHGFNGSEWTEAIQRLLRQL